MSPPIGGSPSEPTSAESAASAEADRDEAAQEQAIVNDPRVIAAARKVRVIQNESLDCPSEVLGLVDVHERVESVDRALEVLRRKAAKVGAEAVIGVEFHHGEPGEEPTHLSGMAVRCNDLIKGRQYDVLGRIEVPGKMGDEDGAEHELLARARAMRADLVIDMGFEHGEGGEQPTRVWGTAIRFVRPFR
jgi:uncharacterized protein YbjQ (UPF0145 family)